MKKFRNLKQKIIFYVMSVSILLTVLITAVMSFGSIRSTNKLQLDNIQVTTGSHPKASVPIFIF